MAAQCTYQSWRDLGPQPPGEHVAPVASLWKEKEERSQWRLAEVACRRRRTHAATGC